MDATKRFEKVVIDQHGIKYEYISSLGHGNKKEVREKSDLSSEDDREYTMQILSKENNKYSLKNRAEDI